MPDYDISDESARCGFCGSAMGDHANCQAAFDNGESWAAYCEGIPFSLGEVDAALELAAIRAATVPDA